MHSFERRILKSNCSVSRHLMNEVVSSVSESPLKPAAASGAEQLKQSIAFESFFLKVNDVISVFNSRHLNLIRVLRAEEQSCKTHFSSVE